MCYVSRIKMHPSQYDCTNTDISISIYQYFVKLRQSTFRTDLFFEGEMLLGTSHIYLPLNKDQIITLIVACNFFGFLLSSKRTTKITSRGFIKFFSFWGMLFCNTKISEVFFIANFNSFIYYPYMHILSVLSMRSGLWHKLSPSFITV